MKASRQFKKVSKNIVSDVNNLDLAAFAYRQLTDLVRYAYEQMAYLLPPWVQAVPLRMISMVVFRLESARRRVIRLRRLPVQYAYHLKGKTVPAIDEYMDRTPVPARALWDLCWTTRHWSIHDGMEKAEYRRKAASQACWHGLKAVDRMRMFSSRRGMIVIV